MIKMEDMYPLILEAFKQNKTFSFPVHGTSMQPMLHTQDIVEIEEIKQYKKGDIILYRRENGQFVLHRVRKIKKDILYFVGDHQTKVEKGILPNQCIGKVISYKKKKNNKTYKLHNFSYCLYCFLVRIRLFRLFCAKFL